MLAKINVFIIIKDYVATLRAFKKTKTSASDIILFFGVPIVIAVLLLALRTLLTQNGISVMITSFSVFAALLLNMLLLIYNYMSKKDDSEDGSEKEGLYSPAKIKKQFIFEIYAAISFGILVSIVLIIVLLVSTLNVRHLFNPIAIEILKNIVSFAVYFLVSNFVLTMTMILKRIYVLLKDEMKQ